jgi:1-acyl-sn-glycerol-3-phosphate acyltransferase
MITANHASWFERIFLFYLKQKMRRHFHSSEIRGCFDDKKLPILVIANHISWWDGFWILLLNKKLTKRKLYVMMLEEQLRQNMFLRKLGAFSIRKKSKSALESLNYAASILKNPANMLLFYPQGEIQSQHQQTFRFQPGWGRIVEKPEQPLQILMVANVIDYFSNARPTLRQYIHSPEQISGFSATWLEQEYNLFYLNSVKQQESS